MRRRSPLARLAALALVLAASCGKVEPDRGGLMLLLSQDGDLALDKLEVRVTSGEKVLLDSVYHLPAEASLPTTIAIVSNSDPAATASIHVVGWKGKVPVDVRDNIVKQIPVDRVTAFPIVLSARCSDQVQVVGDQAFSKCDDGNGATTCNPATGDCVPTEVDASQLDVYQPGAEDVAAGGGSSLDDQGGAAGASDSASGSGGDETSASGSGGATAGSGGKSTSGGTGGKAGSGTGGTGGTGGGGAGGKAGSGGMSGGGAGGSGGSGGAGGSGGVLSCTLVSDCPNNDVTIHNVCDAKKCRVSGCNAINCAYELTRVVVGSKTGAVGQVFVTWSATSLDLDLQIHDLTPQNDSANHWEDDSVEIFLDLNHAKGQTYDGDDFQIIVPRAAGVPSGVGPVTFQAITVVRTESAAGYELMVTLPWSALNGAASQVGKAIGFSIGVDDDTDGGTRDKQVVLFGDELNYMSSAKFGTLTLTP